MNFDRGNVMDVKIYQATAHTAVEHSCFMYTFSDRTYAQTVIKYLALRIHATEHHNHAHLLSHNRCRPCSHCSSL